MFCRKTDILSEPIATMIIGYGNSMRADDGAGPALVEQLAELLPNHEAAGVRLIACPQLTPELAADIAQAKKVLFVDASIMVKAGHVRIRQVHPDTAGMTMGHHFTPATVLALADHVFAARPATWLAAIGCESLAMDNQLTPRIAGTVERLARHIKYQLLLQYGFHNQEPNVRSTNSIYVVNMQTRKKGS